MTPGLIFSLGNKLALVGWLALVFASRVQIVPTVLCKFVIPGLIAIGYASVLATHWAGHPGGFESVTAVQQLFGDPWLVTAGWLHYLAFDLFVGAWQVREAQRCGISHGWTLPCLFMTYLLGPAGFILFLMLKSSLTKKPMVV